MGKYMRKAKMTGEVAVMEVVSQTSLGVRTRAKTLALQKSNSSSSASYLQLRSRRLQKPLPPSAADSKKPKESCKQTSSSNIRLVSFSEISVSFSKKDDTVDAALETDRDSVNAELFPEASFGENIPEIDGRERNIRETTPSSLIRGSETLETPGSTTRRPISKTTNRRKENMTCQEIPTAEEMEEFFAAAEQEQQRLFTEKYNFNLVSDMPMAGRYEWVRLDI